MHDGTQHMGRRSSLDKLKALPQLARRQRPISRTRGCARTSRLDRDTAARLGLNTSTIDNTLYDAFGQRQVSTMFTQLNQYHVILEVDARIPAEPDRPRTRSISRPPARHGFSTTSGSFGTELRQREVRRSRPRFHQYRHGRARRNALDAAERLRALGDQAEAPTNAPGAIPGRHALLQSAPGASLSDAVEAINKARSRTSAHAGRRSRPPSRGKRSPPFRTHSLTERTAAACSPRCSHGLHHSGRALRELHPSHHDSFHAAFSAGVGALLALMLFGHDDLNVIALIGIILLIGIVQKERHHDGRLRPRAAEREQGKTIRSERNLSGLPAALRPILMTTLAAMFGGSAARAWHRHRLGIAAAARHRHRGRAHRKPAPDALHHAGHLSRVRPHCQYAGGFSAIATAKMCSRSEPPLHDAEREPAEARR